MSSTESDSDLYKVEGIGCNNKLVAAYLTTPHRCGDQIAVSVCQQQLTLNKISEGSYGLIDISLSLNSEEETIITSFTVKRFVNNKVYKECVSVYNSLGYDGQSLKFDIGDEQMKLYFDTPFEKI